MNITGIYTKHIIYFTIVNMVRITNYASYELKNIKIHKFNQRDNTCFKLFIITYYHAKRCIYVLAYRIYT